MELVHGHIAKQPPSLTQFNIPEPLDRIVAKLMAKNAEDRYQSSLGFKHDLEICLHQLNETGKIEAFEIGKRDLCDRFNIPEKLYGRKYAQQLEQSQLQIVQSEKHGGQLEVISEIAKGTEFILTLPLN